MSNTPETKNDSVQLKNYHLDQCVFFIACLQGRCNRLKVTQMDGGCMVCAAEVPLVFSLFAILF